MLRNEQGVALLEVLVALAIMSVAGIALVGAVDGALRAGAFAQTREAEAARQDEVLNGLALMTAAEYDERLGIRSLGGYAVDIERPRPGLYRISVAERKDPLLPPTVTMVYRAPEPGP